MKKLLLDSHELVWILYEPDRINKNTKELINSASAVYVSIASIWELCIKHGAGKFGYAPEEFIDKIEVLGAKLLRIEPGHILELKNIKTPHKDPFDRMLLAQAKAESMSLVTVDSEILSLGLDYVIDARK